MLLESCDASIVIDPDLPDHVRKFLDETPPSTLKIYGDPALPTASALGDVGGYLVRFGAPLGAATGLWWVLDRGADLTASAEYATNTGALHYLISHAAESLGNIMPLAACVAAIYIIFMTMVARNGTRMWREVRATRERYVLPSQLTGDASVLLRRAWTAARQVLGSEVHARDLIDRQHAQIQLPAQVWDVARSLAAYSRFVDETPTTYGEEAAVLLKARNSALSTGLGAVERQVEALEGYAAQTAEADARLHELQQVEQLEASSGKLLDFLASTARADVAVDGLSQMSDAAAVVADRLTTALIAAREAAAQALPAAPSGSGQPS
ncbi:hypothetical protein ACFYPC_33830 [Streptomyces sp. NPDC005808]|uniref:hypothetical protein n=1 Tax=Streptomyces sp. NPDC005808 TaxID=3364734 RepID=UPI0036CD1345